MNALVPINAAPALTVSDVEKVAHAIAKGGLFGSKDPYAVLTLCLLAQAEGQHPAVVFRDYHIIQGKPAKKADAMLRDFVTAGGKVEWHKLDDEMADATFSHPGGGSVRIDWTMARAKKAGLSTQMWQKYPRQMLRSRVISEGVRTVFPGATSGLYVPEEVAAFEPTQQSAPEPIEADTDEAMSTRDEPAAREKLDGKHSSKTALKAALRSYGAKVTGASTARELDAIDAEYADDLAQGHEYLPLWMDADPSKDNKGLVLLAAERRNLLVLIDGLRANRSRQELTNWMAAYENQVEQLDDASRRQFEKAFEEVEAGWQLAATVAEGA